MRFPLRDKKVSEKIIHDLKKIRGTYKIMHVCGTHQDTLVRFGLDHLFKKCGIKILQGPGCPICVTTPREIEEGLYLARQGKTIATFGDMLRVPGKSESLKSLREKGCDINIVYGINDAVKLANKKKEVVFMAIGFETTAPSTASTLLEKPPHNFSILNCHRYVPPVLHAVLEIGDISLDGIIQPGHVSAIIGLQPYEFISRDYGIPQVVAGFEPLDLLMGVWMIMQQIKTDDPHVDNEYKRVVKYEGNRKALAIMKEIFTQGDIKWRGFPLIPKSFMALKEKYEKYDARKKYKDVLKELYHQEFKEPKECRCGEVLRGIITSQDCPLFGTKCTPSTPIGPCMVSREGSCNIEYRYR
jgi:hydrogenase expression/formation protein HypD